MDVSTDPRTREAWEASTRASSHALPDSRVWRRLLAEFDAGELVLYLDVFTDGSRDVFVAVTSERLLSWTVLSDRFRRMVRRSVQVTEHTRTVNGVLRLSDGSSSTPLRLVGRPEQRTSLLKVLRLPADARPVQAVVLDLTTSPKTKSAYAASPLPPPATGPVADAVLSALGSAKAQCLVRAAQISLHPALPGGEVVVGTGTKITFVAVGADAKSRPTMGIGRGSLRWDLRGHDLTLFHDQPTRSTVAQLRGDARALEAVVALVRRWAELDAVAEGQRTVKQQARRVAAADGVPAIPAIRRTGLLGRKRAAPIGTWQQAEAAACAWLRQMGYHDAKVTPTGKDAGVDVIARKVVAQVKWEATPVGRPKVQQLHGAAAHARKKGAFFSRSGYTADARAWAETAGIAAFVLLDDGSLAPTTSAAKKMMR
ncbi:hypothetical protein JCM18899A_27400 [Nocardioides sp. AN3]